ncbi:MAG: indolepyruvate ferredoxin oxidoreductase subunit alpha [Gammaproteobacteria bacterium]|nr:indolepyruvate ferredoxin oxidoreductase subunit alpha [Gammaproteobacteria bacterium]
MNDSNANTDTKVLMYGNQAIAHGAREAGCYFGVGYPGTPSTEILQDFGKFPGVFAKWSPNEKVALEVGIGASLTGSRTICTMKHVGVNVAMDPLMTFTYTGVVGGFVLVVADDPGMHSSQNEQDSRILGKFAKIPVLEPADSQEAVDFVKQAFEISEQFNTPVMLRETTRIAHAKGLVEIGEWQEPVRGKSLKQDPSRFIMMPIFARSRHSFAENRSIELAKFSDQFAGNILQLNSNDVGIITSGIAAQYIQELLPDASFLKIGMSWPFPAEKARQLAKHVKRVIVVEELEPYLEEEAIIAGIKCEGKAYFPREGELDLDTVRLGLFKAGLGEEPEAKTIPTEVVQRPPVLCSGCPHRGIYMAINKLRADVFGDIGCYTLAALPPLNSIHTAFCMGASIGNAVGASLNATDTKRPTVAVIGDGTFLHSGITGLIDLFTSNANATVVIVDNSITAMTGGQPNPAAGYDLMHNEVSKVDLRKIIEGIGIEDIYDVDPYLFDDAVDKLQQAVAYEGTSVVISSKSCALFPGKLKPDPFYVEDECNGCAVCLRIACPAIFKTGEVTDKGKAKVAIDENACTGCALCEQVCKVDVIHKQKPSKETQA